ncbi:MAG: hypothetical protein AAFR67_10665, partial [Chloroflexota bacterium]
YVIATTLEFFEDANPDATQIGVNVFDNRKLNGALIYGVLSQLQPDEAISYSGIGDILNIHGNTVGRAVKKLVADGYVTKEDFGSAGAKYTLHDWNLPLWVIHFAGALAELHEDDAMMQQASEYSDRVQFRRGMQVLRDELTEKFYKRGKRDSDA